VAGQTHDHHRTTIDRNYVAGVAPPHVRIAAPLYLVERVVPPLVSCRGCMPSSGIGRTVMMILRPGRARIRGEMAGEYTFEG
jgi:hypothetical protein